MVSCARMGPNNLFGDSAPPGFCLHAASVQKLQPVLRRCRFRDHRARAASPPQATPAQTKTAITNDVVDLYFSRKESAACSAVTKASTAEAEKLAARVRPNPADDNGFVRAPNTFSGPLVASQTFAYNISQDIELGGKRSKRINLADADAEVAKAQFEVAVWQLTNDVIKFFTPFCSRGP